MSLTLTQQMTLLSNLPMNGGRVPVGALNRREEYAEMEQNGWLAYCVGDILPYLEITPVGRRAAHDYWLKLARQTINPNGDTQCPTLKP